MLSNYFHLIVLSFGFSILLTGLIGTFYYIPLLEFNYFQQLISLESGTAGFERWQNPDYQLRFRVYIFDVKNLDEVQSGSKPVFIEKGPYVYNEVDNPRVEEINKEKDTLRFIKRRYFYFNAAESGPRREDDLVTIVNVPLLGLVRNIGDSFPEYLGALNTEGIPNMFPDAENVFVTAKVEDILFGKKLVLPECPDKSPPILCQSIHTAVTPRVDHANPNNNARYFSLFARMNNSDDRMYNITVMRGLKKARDKGRIVEVGLESEPGHILTRKQNDKKCNLINGTDFLLFDSFENTPQKIFVYLPDIARSVSLNFEKNEAIHGLDMLKYSINKDPFVINTNPICVCDVAVRIQKRERVESLQCPLAGTHSLKRCLNINIVLSFPHFYLGDDNLRNISEVLKADKDLHETFIFIEPRSGLPTLRKLRLQYNIKMDQNAEIDLLNNVTDGLIPIVWTEEELTQPEQMFRYIKHKGEEIDSLQFWKYIVVLTGLLTMLLSVPVLACLKRNVLCNKDKKDISTIKKWTSEWHQERKELHMVMHYPNLFPQTKNSNTYDGFKKEKM